MCCPAKKAEMLELLSVLDKNNDKKVSVDELKEFLEQGRGTTLDKSIVQKFIDKHDKDKDGKLDLEELAECLACA
ncbi:hypothetical protein CRM22_010200 [Opisthorchis felineus]|uniref:EF-hand domain-containing protein n=2 Tax=Opisthorchis felineus TaxID=147828 RepID=A0A4S2L0A9_OPIFE|nr:hypothetical protein CRM22_010200 [Opisthorchis felineus]TGZ56132.1 hypothetical protein CRM22_010200 [Opisthorchis felineus]